MNHTFHKPMAADYARLVVTKTSHKTANSSQTTRLSKPSHCAVGPPDSASTVTVESTTSVSGASQDHDDIRATEQHKKKTWWKQLVMSQSTFVMLKASS